MVLPVATDADFSDCTALTTVTLPAATSIGEDAFYICRALTMVSLPVVASISQYAFGHCPALTEVEFGTTPPILIGTNIFYGTGSGTITIKFPALSPNTGWVSENTSHWGSGAKTIVQGTY